MEALAQLLSRDPALIGHPAVYHQISRLLWLPRVPDEGEDGCLPDVDYCPPAGTRQAARDSLRALVEAWVHGVLGEGWTLKPPKKRAGRKRPFEDISWDYRLLSTYEEVLTQLRQHPVRRAKGESDKHWIKRLCDIVGFVWRGCFYHLLPGEIPLGGSEHDFNRPIIRKSVPLPATCIRAWANGAIELSAEGPIRDRLAYEMIGYRFNLRPHQVRGRIQVARKENRVEE
jgi:hypothetical protein